MPFGTTPHDDPSTFPDSSGRTASLRRPARNAPWRSSALRLLLPAAGLYVGLGAALRLVLWFGFGRTAGVSSMHLPAVLGIGLVNDLVIALYLLLPLHLLWVAMPARWRRSRIVQGAAAVGTWSVLFGLMYLSAAEYFFFDEFDARLNLVAVDYLIYPHEVLINIRDSYPVVPVLLAAAGVAALLTFAAKKLWTSRLRVPSMPLRPAAGFGLHLALAAVLMLTLSTYTLSSLSASENRVEQELEINGISSFFQAARTQEVDYYAYYAVRSPEQMLARLARHLDTAGTRFTHLAEGRLDRRFGPDRIRRAEPTAVHAVFRSRPDPAGSFRLAHGRGESPFVQSAPTAVAKPQLPNVVVIAEESLGAEFLGAYGDDRGLSPSFDRLAEQGLLFTHAYATGTRTVRGLEAITASFPPIPSVSILRRPGSEGAAVWNRVMTQLGYESSFLYGGYAYFDNMAHYFSTNGFAVSDRTEIDNPVFANIWGVSDQDLFDHALDYYDRSYDRQSRTGGAPFFSLIMTTSNHKPFTFPAGVPGVPEEGGGRLAGIRYADWALGRFLEDAESHPWFEDTLFVVVGDHGARVYGAAQIPLHTYTVPILFYAPERLPAARVDVLTSQIDIAPTLLGLLGVSYEAPFFGQNVLALPPDTDRTLLFNHNHDVALLRGDEMVVLGLHRAVDSYRVADNGRDMTPIETNPELADLAIAYYQTAYDLFEQHLYR